MAVQKSWCRTAGRNPESPHSRRLKHGARSAVLPSPLPPPEAEAPGSWQARRCSTSAACTAATCAGSPLKVRLRVRRSFIAYLRPAARQATWRVARRGWRGADMWEVSDVAGLDAAGVKEGGGGCDGGRNGGLRGGVLSRAAAEPAVGRKVGSLQGEGGDDRGCGVKGVSGDALNG
jgi:hypothetical protein